MRTPPIRRRTLQLAVAGGALGVAVLAASVVGVLRPAPLVLHACFVHAGGLEDGDPVMLNGVRVGSVADVELDAELRACARLRLRPSLRLDRDTSAAIFTLDVLGGKYVSLEPGGDSTLLVSGDEIHYTQSALPLERILIRVLEHQMGTCFD